MKEVFNQKKDAFAENIISKRLLHRQSLESFRCLTEGVLRSTTDGDIGSVLGWGFPIYTGGALSYIDYVGMENFIKDCDEFKSKFGDHWDVPSELRKLLKEKKSVHDFKI